MEKTSLGADPAIWNSIWPWAAGSGPPPLAGVDSRAPHCFVVPLLYRDSLLLEVLVLVGAGWFWWVLVGSHSSHLLGSFESFRGAVVSSTLYRLQFPDGGNETRTILIHRCTDGLGPREVAVQGLRPLPTDDALNSKTCPKRGLIGSPYVRGDRGALPGAAPLRGDLSG